MMYTQPTFYIPHGGGPCFFMPDPSGMWKEMERALRSLATSTNENPKAILVISSHWEEEEFTFATNPSPPLIYDYSGFPEHTYKLTYPAPGSPELANHAASLLQAAGIKTNFNLSRGFDHGVFVPFLLIYPNADIPIVQMSLKTGLSPEAHLAAGRALAPLREEGILIVGSGMSYHNMRGFSPRFTESSKQFDSWLNETVTEHKGADRSNLLANWEKAPEARTAHPREEHFISLLVAAGAAEHEEATTFYNGNVMNVAVSGFRFG